VSKKTLTLDDESWEDSEIGVTTRFPSGALRDIDEQTRYSLHDVETESRHI